MRVDLSVFWANQPGNFVWGTISQEFKVPLKWNRRDAATTANFLLPSPLAGPMNAYATVNLDNGWPDPDPTNNQSPITGVQVVDTRPATIAWLRMNYQPDPAVQYARHPFNGPNLADAKWVATAPLQSALWLLPTAKLNYWSLFPGIEDYYFELPEKGTDGKLTIKRFKPDLRDDFTWHEVTSQAADVFLKTRLIDMSGSQPTFDTLFAWFPPGSTYQAPFDAKSEGAPPVVPNGKGRVAFSAVVNPAPHLMPHEVSHNLGLGHFPCGLNPVQTHPWPAPYNNCDPIEIPFDPVKMQANNSYTFMTYGGSSIAPVEWKYLLDKLKTGGGASAAPAQPAQAGPSLRIAGWLTANGQGEFSPVYNLDEPPVVPEASTTALGEIRLLDGTGQTIGSYRFHPQFETVESSPADFAAFVLQLPQPAGLEGIQLLYDDNLVAERRSSAHAPEVQFVSPPPGPLDGTTSITWQASDLDDDPLFAMVLYSHDGGARWHALGNNLSVPSYDLDTEGVPGCESCLVKVLVSDGWQTGEAVGGPFTIQRKPPDVAIAAPVDGEQAREEQAWVLVGAASDLEDGPLPGEALF